MTPVDAIRASDEDLARAYSIAQDHNISDPSDVLIDSILGDLHGRKQPTATGLCPSSEYRRVRATSTSPEHPTFARLPLSPTPCATTSTMADGQLPGEVILTTWGQDFTSISSDSETVAASSSSPTEAGSPSAHAEAITISDGEDNKADAEQYLMSGALHLDDLHPSEIHPQARLDDSSAVCKDSFPSLMHHQPFRILGRDDVYRYVWDRFDDPSIIGYQLREDMLTTIFGLQKALEEVQEYEHWNDEMLMGAVVYKTGIVSEWKSVIYPEDIEPWIGEDNDFYEWDYWEKLREQGRVWEETGVIDEPEELGLCESDATEGAGSIRPMFSFALCT